MDAIAVNDLFVDCIDGDVDCETVDNCADISLLVSIYAPCELVIVIVMVVNGTREFFHCDGDGDDAGGDILSADVGRCFHYKLFTDNDCNAEWHCAEGGVDDGNCDSGDSDISLR